MTDYIMRFAPSTCAVIEAARNADGPVTPKDIMGSIEGMTYKAAGQYLRRLVAANILTKVRRGVYLYQVV